jgi:4-amino-4-deoxy-L-arabinose transferase-like glycosyltransferase
LRGGGFLEFPPEKGRRAVLGLILGSAFLRLAIGSVLGLSVDESYAVVMSRKLSLSYFDHPPILFWLPGLASRLAGSEAPLVVRLPFILLFMGTTWILYRLTAWLFDEVAGVLAACALNLILFFTLSVGSWVLPDGPLLFFSAAAVFCLARACLKETGDSTPASPGLAPWLGFGFFSGLGLLSKYHAVFLLGGAFLFLVSSKEHRRLLRHPGPYLAVVLALVVFLPVLVWNAEHGWASFRFQSGRAVPLEPENDTPFWGSIAGQAAWMLPWLWIPLLLVLARALLRGPGEARRWFCACLGVGPIVVFTAVTLFGRRGLPHWQAPGYFLILPLLGTWLARASFRGRFLVGSTMGLLVILGILVTHATTGWIEGLAPSLLVKGDPTHDLLSWGPIAKGLKKRGYPKEGLWTVGATWVDAAKLGYALGPGVPISSVGGDPRGFEFVRSQESLVGEDLLLVASRRAGYMEPMIAYAPYFQGITGIATIPIVRGGREEIAVSVYLCRHLLKPVPPTTRVR